MGFLGFLGFLRGDPVMAWFLLLALLVTVVPLAVVIWQKIAGQGPDGVEERAAQSTKPVRFGSQTDLIILLIALFLIIFVLQYLLHLN